MKSVSRWKVMRSPAAGLLKIAGTFAAVIGFGVGGVPLTPRGTVRTT
jgi:hypothetical protein